MNNLNKQSHYPRNEIRSELATRQTTKDNIIIDYLENKEIKAMQLKAKNYNYTAIYAYLMDLICAFVTDYRNIDGAITELKSNYYMIKLKRETVEKYAFGTYTKVKSKFWKALYKILSEPKTLYMNTDEGDYLGEPIRLTAQLKDGTIYNPNFNNLQNATQMIEILQIEFFKPMFKQVVEYHQNWIPLPRYLQAIIDTEIIENPKITEWKELSHYYNNNETYFLTSQQIRLYFLYMSDHNNNIGEYMNINAIDFWQSVHADNVKIVKQETNTYKAFLTDWNKSRYEFNALARVHSSLAQKGLIEGINFTTCQSWYDQQTKTYKVKISREKPLQNAPAYIECSNETRTLLESF